MFTVWKKRRKIKILTDTFPYSGVISTTGMFSQRWSPRDNLDRVQILLSRLRVWGSVGELFYIIYDFLV